VSLLYIICFLFDLSRLIFHRNEDVAIQRYDEPFQYFPSNHSGLYNSMIYPFTRMVIYGSIWYQGRSKQFLYGIKLSLILFT
jgi:hypothetical protein